jgi:RNA polymerase sigma-70 factor (ECF subfamily)
MTFPSTFWTRIHADPEGARAEVFTQYRAPVYRFILARVRSEHDADDLTQEVFAIVCRSEFLKKADREKGKFRSLLLGVAKKVLMKAKTRRVVLPLEIDPPAPEPEFDDLWLQNLLRLALERVREEAPRQYEALALAKLQGLSYAEAAARLGAKESDVTNWIHQGKERLKLHLRELVRAYASSEGEYDEEMALVKRGLK